ncbi:MAG: hypothetical protein GY787_22420 [Alteromonadales bacterium]|nr:hypothetical protein [Alteromonadales bacterium]
MKQTSNKHNKRKCFTEQILMTMKKHENQVHETKQKVNKNYKDWYG